MRVSPPVRPALRPAHRAPPLVLVKTPATSVPANTLAAVAASERTFMPFTPVLAGRQLAAAVVVLKTPDQVPAYSVAGCTGSTARMVIPVLGLTDASPASTALQAAPPLVVLKTSPA